jgi:hypothetical protein
MSTLDRIVLSAECWRCLCVTRVPLHQGAPVLVGCMGCGQPWVDAEALADDYHRARVALEEYASVRQELDDLRDTVAQALALGKSAKARHLLADALYHGVEQRRPLVGGRVTDSDDQRDNGGRSLAAESGGSSDQREEAV